MKTALIGVLAMAISSSALADQIGNTSWNESNISSLRDLDRAAVENFVNEASGGDPLHRNVGEFVWADLAGNEQYELVVTLDLSGRGFFDYLAIYKRDGSGNIDTQWFEGETAVGKLSEVIRDLNGDGRDELIIPTVFPPTSHGADAVNTVWPAVYQLRNGKYIEASKEFAGFYDAAVLPELERSITESREKITTEPRYRPKHFAQTLERDKILRVLGRNPAAGLADAREWIRSGDPNLVSAGAAVLEDIGGYQDEVRTARDALKRAIERKTSGG